MFEFTSQQLLAMVANFVWPLTRILGLFSSAPIFSQSNFPMQARLGLGLAMTVLISPNLILSEIPDPISLDGLIILINQFLIGVSIGFIMRIFFTAIELTGDLIGMSMGMGFASFYDPSTQAQTQVISQFLTMITILLFFNADMHLIVIDTLINSFQTIPIDSMHLNTNAFKTMGITGAQIFSLGLQLSLPIVTALLITNLALGVLTRAAPQLNIYGIGFPITMSVGFLMIFIALPYMILPFIQLMEKSVEFMRIYTIELAQ